METAIYIDGRRADMDRSATVSVSLSIGSATSIEHGKAGYSKSITIPATPRNRELMGDCEQMNNRDMFNTTAHTARIECDGCTVMEGMMMLTACGTGHGGKGGGSYRFNIIGGGKGWAVHATGRSLSTLGIEYEATLNAQTIQESWTAEGCPVRFLPVQRGRYTESNSSVGLEPAARVLSASDYHPFLHLRTIVERIFAEAGYRVVSKFMESGMFGSLYISGRYPTRDVEALRSKMDFRAGRWADITAVADSSGRVYADPLANYNTVGNIVETADPSEVRNGAKAEGVYDNGGCFSREGDAVVFTPVEEVAVSFEYKIKYITDYRILSRTELAGFNRISLPYNDTRTFRIANTFADRRESFGTGRSYLLVVFGHTEGNSYRLTAEVTAEEVAGGATESPAEAGTILTVAEFQTRSTQVCCQEEGTPGNLRLLVSTGGEYAEYGGDWALYDGYIGEKGEKEIEVTLRGECERLSPSKPKRFDPMWFGGAEAGMKLTIETGTTVRPIFNPHPTEGSKLDFAQVACHNFSRLELINAVKHMFNLCFYTDSRNGAVYIEPRGEFYTEAVTDWSGRMDRSMPILMQELGDSLPRRSTFRYRPGDKATAEYNRERGGELGAWTAGVESLFATEQEKVYENPLFAPTLNVAGCLPNARSARLMQAGDTGEEESDGLNFTEKIVRYMGMVPLAEGEEWSYPSWGGSYPYAAFHNPDGTGGEAFTLCFEDRDGAKGLHTCWEWNFRHYNRSKRVTAYMRLYPEEIEALAVPGNGGGDFRGCFALETDGERGLYRLEEVCDYNPSAKRVKCVFIKKV